MTDVRQIAQSNGASVVLVGNRVYEASKYAPEIIHFTKEKYLFLNRYFDGMELAEAAQKSGMTAEDAGTFVETPKAVDWLRRRAVREYIRKDWEGGGKWWEMGDKVMKGEKHFSKDQQVVYMAFAERCAPKPRSEDSQPKTVINFNFSAKDVEEAFKRQSAIDAELA